MLAPHVEGDRLGELACLRLRAIDADRQPRGRRIAAAHQHHRGRGEHGDAGHLRPADRRPAAEVVTLEIIGQHLLTVARLPAGADRDIWRV